MTKSFGKPALLFAATQRSGSTMVVDDFQNITGRSRTESEAFYRQVIAAERSSEDWDVTVEKVKAFRDKEVIFFDKIMFHQMTVLSEMIDPERHTPACLPFFEYFRDATWVYIRRANAFEQVVSKYIAEALNVWDKADAKSDDFNSKFEFNIELAKVHLRSLLKEDEQWQVFFRRHKISPIEIYYEDAVSNFPNYLAPVLEKIGVSANLEQTGERRMRKLGNSRNENLANVLMHMMMRENIQSGFEFKQFIRNAKANQ
ncbi:hypothetical protein FDP22_23270 (plasmid) [Paroceanicella profunda]|uniref:Sulphotransferase Stf0 domain-containing protein n=1 Tax=Paroceanicella profunda TaxID=2579971 RepID=A0A5B8G5X3_9RHOB|nr:Stf0 family sulfotransferase [Paroceanicella profunda]QDL94792.1 hypothetical protein FDP22_23270 [Paroceanicella profunda]